MLSFAMYRFTQRNILRVYPKGTRFNSSNYNPRIGWVHGAQMVAFNMQVWFSVHLSLVAQITIQFDAPKFLLLFILA